MRSVRRLWPSHDCCRRATIRKKRPAIKVALEQAAQKRGRDPKVFRLCFTTAVSINFPVQRLRAIGGITTLLRVDLELQRRV
jgi:hypothetical protein